MGCESNTGIAPNSIPIPYNYEDRIKKEENKLPVKRFIVRESLLTVLFENIHLKTIHHMFIALCLGLILTTITRDFLENHEIVLGFRLIYSGFSKFHIAISAWLMYYFFTCCSFFAFKLWAGFRIKICPKENYSRKILDYTCGIFLVSYYVFSFKLAEVIVTNYKLYPASAAALLLEQTRMAMKVHAFVRSNIPKVITYKEKSDDQLKLPKFSHFLYFTMAPTLIYRDEYPRTSTIRWRFVFGHALDAVLVVLAYSFVMERFLIPTYKDFGIRKLTYTELFLNVMEKSLPGLVYLLMTFYLILHSVHNFFAELLRFGDRMFYKDWWTATDYTTWFRSWNVVVHDWLYTYIYKDSYEVFVPKNKTFAKYATFLISAVVHEWILMYMFGYFFPVMFVLFLFSMLLTHSKLPNCSILNILLWMSFSFGPGIMISGYIIEFCARINNVPSLYPDYDFYIPRCLTCESCFD